MLKNANCCGDSIKYIGLKLVKYKQAYFKKEIIR